MNNCVLGTSFFQCSEICGINKAELCIPLVLDYLMANIFVWCKSFTSVSQAN